MNHIKIILIIILLVFLPAYAKKENEYSYQKGLLLDILNKPITHTTYHGSQNTKYNGNNTASSNLFLFPSSYTENHHYFIIKVSNIAYLCEHQYLLNDAVPSEWIVGDPIYVRFNDKKTKAYIKRPQGKYIKELSTKIIKKVRA